MTSRSGCSASDALATHDEDRRDLAQYLAQNDEFDRFCKLIGYEPHEGQRQVHQCDAPRRVVRWGRRAGKTLMAAVEAAFVLLQNRKRVWIVAPDHDLSGRVWDELVRILCDELGFEPTTRSDRSRRLVFDWGSRCEGKSTGHGSQKGLVGAAVDFLVWDEVAKSPAGIWELRLMPNLADRHGRALLISTPEGYNHFHELWKRGHNDDVAWRSFHAPSAMNPHLPRDVIEEARRTYSPEAFAQEWEAKFTHLAGRVYTEFEESIHVRPLQHDPDLPLALAFDFGVENPFVCLWVQFTPEDNLRVIDEYVQRGETTLTNGQRVMAQHEERGYGDVSWAAADPSGKDGRLTLRKHCGIPTTFRRLTGRGDSMGEKQAGIEQIRRLLRGVDGRMTEPRLFIDPRCQETIREFNLYRYPEAKQERNASEEPEKANDHCMDALRYAVAVWLARVPERERLKIAATAGKQHRTGKEKLLERAMGDGIL